MANSGSNRDVELALKVTTSGAEDIQKLQSDVEALAKQGGAAAPKFLALAEEIGKLGVKAQSLESLGRLGDDIAHLAAEEGAAAAKADQLQSSLSEVSAKVAQFTLAQNEAMSALTGAKNALFEQKQALSILKNETDAADKKTESYKSSVRALNSEIIAAKPAIRDLGTAYGQVASDTKILVDAEKNLVAVNNQAQRAAYKAAEALLTQTANMRDARDAAVANGTVTKNLAESQERLVEALQKSEVELQRLVAVQHASTEAAKQQAREDERLTAIMLNSKRELLAAGQQQLAVERLIYAEMEAGQRRAAEAAKQQLAVERQTYADMEAGQRRAAEAARQSGDAINTALRVVGVRGAVAINAEIKQVRDSLVLLKSSGTLAGAELNTAMGIGARRVKELERNLREANGQLTLGDQAAKLFSSSIGQFAAGNLVANAIAAIGSKVVDMAKAFVTANVQMESTRRALTAVYGSAATAASQIDFLKTTSTSAGISMSGITDSFVKFNAATKSSNIPLDVTNALFASVTRAGSTLGLSTERVTLVLDALGQVASKGVVSMEELRQQLGDSLPGALSLAAKGLGITDAELIKLVESGKLAAIDFFPALTIGLQGLQGEADTLTTRFANLTNALYTTAVQGGDAGWMEILKAGLTTLKIALFAVIAPMSAFFEVLVILTKQAAVFFSALTQTLNPIEAFRQALKFSGEELDAAAKRQSDLTDSFFATTAAATSAVPAIGKNSAAIIENSIAVENGAKSTQASGVAAIGAGNAYVQMLVSMLKVTQSIESNIVASEKLLNAKQLEGKALLHVAQLTGNAVTVLDAATASTKANADAAATVVTAREAEVRSTQLVIATTIAMSAATTGLAESRKKDLEKHEAQLVLQKASLEKSVQERNELQAQADVAAVASLAYRDNSASVAAYKLGLDLARKSMPLFADAVVAANVELGLQNKLFIEGRATQSAVQSAQAGVTQALRDQSEALLTSAKYENLYRDAIADRVKNQELATQAASIELQKTAALVSVEQKHSESMAAQARATGDLVTATYFDIDAKLKQIKSIEIKLKIQQLEINADIAALQIKKAELDATDPLLKMKQKEIDIRIESQKIKLIETGASKEQIAAIQSEIAAIRQGTSAQGADTTARSANTAAGVSQSEAMDTLAMKYKLLADYTISQTALLEKQTDATRKLTEAENKRRGVDKDGFSANPDGSRVVMGGDLTTRTGIFNFLKSAGVTDEAKARGITSEFANSKGEIDYFNNAGQIKYGGAGSTMSQALLKAAEAFVFSSKIPTAPTAGGVQLPASTVAGTTVAATTVAATTPGTNTSRVITINIGNSSTNISVASEQDANNLQSLLQKLAQSKSVSA